MIPFNVQADTSKKRFVNHECYARCLQNCSQKISGEHYFTYELLRKIASDTRGIHLKGAPWNPSGTWLQPESLTASILCEYHNQQLSPLDAFASSLDDELVRIQSEAISGNNVPTVTRFYGPNLERWLMKSLCGFALARPSIFWPEKDAATIPDGWVKYLFNETELSEPAGFYVSPTIGESRSVNTSGFTFTSLHARGELTGIMVDLRILRIIFISIPWNGTIRGVLNETSIRRPWRINISSQDTSWCLDFDWPGQCGPEALFGLEYKKGIV